MMMRRFTIDVRERPELAAFTARVRVRIGKRRYVDLGEVTTANVHTTLRQAENVALHYATAKEEP